MIAMLDQRKRLQSDDEQVLSAIATARGAQAAWAERPTKARAKLIGSLRPLLARHGNDLAQAAASIGDRPVAEKLVSEVLPLLEACRFLEKDTARVLREKRFGAAGRPLWLHGTSFEVERKPFGVVLIVGPGNYPLFIPMVQALHALAAGNAVVIKPAESTSSLLSLFLDLVFAGSDIPSDLVQLLPETPEAAQAAARCGIDKAIFTGSTENGRAFLTELAKQNIPSVMELSGADAVFVREDADIQLAAKAIAFGSRLNAGNTCMAPHAVIVNQKVAVRLGEALRKLGVAPLGIIPASDDAQALEIAAFDEHGLGASIFSRDEKAARAFASRLATGFVTINDIIVPTADPRFPFGGVRGSGFGVTRGAEGLLEMTYPQAVAVRRGRFLPHLEPAQEGDEELFKAFIECVHRQGWRVRLQSLATLVRLTRERRFPNRRGAFKKTPLLEP